MHLRNAVWLGVLAANLACLAHVPALAQQGPALPETIGFNEHIRPLLSDRCFACHGFDEKKRHGELRLDDRTGAVRDLGGHAAIVPGQPDRSELVNRVASHDKDLVMPPPSANKPRFTEQEVALLRAWIAQGAEYEPHWSLAPMKRPQPPQISPANEARAVNAVDRFLLQKIERHGLGSFASPAGKERLLRRVTLDLTGLPPTPQELTDFLQDESPSAYENVVDRLLASSRYGERMATEWLDLARYADTHGYQVDRFRPMWPYRDWVVRAFNDNLPFDRFVTWQLAGDLLPNPAKDQRLATAFNRLHCQNEEGGVVEEEFRVAYVVDRVNTFGTAFLGVTFECSRCHDHKYDPFTMRDFYSLFSFFQNIPEYGQTSYFTSAMPTPTVLLSTDEQDAALTELDRRVAASEQALARARQAGDAAFVEWLKQRPAAASVAGASGAFDFESLADNIAVNSANAARPGKAVESPQLTDGKHGKAVGLTGENGVTFAGLGDFTRASAFSFGLWLRQPTPSPRAVVFHHSRAPADAGSRGYDLVLEDGRVAFGLYHMWPGNSAKVRTKGTIPPGEWAHVAVTYDGSSRAAGIALYVNGVAAEVDVVTDSLWKDITYDGGEPELAIGYRFRDNGFKEGAVDAFYVFERRLPPLEVAHLAGRSDLAEALRAPLEALDDSQRAGLRELYLATVDEPCRQAQAALFAARDEQRKFVNPIPEAMAMLELPRPKPAFVLKRGNYDQPAEEVAADTPAALPPFPPDAPRNRLGLARWLLDAEHPLTARVTVNRFWQTTFGRGLVETGDNFGTQGATPTHPELLDWLARDFIDSGWNVKRFMKQLAMSGAYRQASRGAAENVERDPDNRWLARAPARRLTAEMLRDQALFASGLLSEKMGGPAVKPYQPAGLWEIAMGNPNYDQSKGADLYRRSLYTFWKRTVPPPSMVTFDAADRSYCTVRRQTTSTPLQALVLLNDPQFVEAARFAGQRMLEEGGSTLDERTAWLFRLIAGRAPAPRETAVLKQIYEEQRALFLADESAARKLLAVGESPPDARLPAADLAAAAMLAQALFNHDEAVYRR